MLLNTAAWGSCLVAIDWGLRDALGVRLARLRQVR